MRKIVVIVTWVVFVFSATAQKKEVKYGQLSKLPRQDEAMKKWRYNRFGQFIHWGLYSIPGGVWKGKTYKYAAEFLRSSANVPASEWDSLIYKFSIKKYELEKWAAMAKDMGAKYVTITTKHHEGSCLWPSEFTDFDIENTPYKKDLLREFVDAYTAAGIDVYFYYSVLDWHNPDWRYDLKNRADTIAFERYKEFVKNQLVELVERYPEVKGLWFDGTWDNSWKKNGKFSYELEKILKEKRPGLIVNSRMRADEYGSRHLDSNGVLMGDYYSGYERNLPDPRDTEIVKRDWECCMTIPANQWGYHRDWSLSHVKTPLELIEMLVQATSQNGNFLLNFGPTGDGEFRKEEVTIAKEIGRWMHKNSECIYGCGYAGLEKQDWGYYTKKGDSNTVYMVVFNVPVSRVLKVELPKNIDIESAGFLDRTDKVSIEKVAQKTGEINYLSIPMKNYTKPFCNKAETDIRG